MINFTPRALIHALVLITAPFLFITVSHAGTLGSSTSWTGGWGWSFSYENMQFTRSSIVLDDGTIIAAPTFDITENPESFTTNTTTGEITGTGSALFKGILKITHGPAPELGEAYAEVQMQWPEIEIIINPEEVSATDSSGDTFVFLKESRIYRVILSSTSSNEGKLTNGTRRVVPELPRSGVYAVCDGTNTSFICSQEIGYGSVAFDPSDVFAPITTASGLTIGADHGFYWDEVCLAFEPEDLSVQVDGQDYTLKEDDDGYFRSCEGRSVAFNTCTRNPFNTNNEFDCNDTNDDGQRLTFILSDAAAGDRLEPAPATTCIGTNVEDWLAFSAFSGSGDDLVVTPCDPNQGFVLLPINFSDSSISFTSSEGGGVQIDDLQIISLSTFGQIDTSFFIQENPDKTEVNWDFSNMILKNISYIASLELNDTITGSAGSDVILTGNGSDNVNGFSGDDCIDGQQNNDHMWGDGHALDHSAGNRGADAFVLTSKLGKDTIYDYSHVDGDVLMNASNTAKPTITDNLDGTYTVALKGQNFVVVHVAEGPGYDPVIMKGLTGVCANHPLNN
jgi:hypothetical protein